MSIQPKPAAQVCAEALARAVEKAGEGCDHCVDALLNLARETGATESQLELARRQADSALAAARTRWTRSGGPPGAARTPPDSAC